MEDHPKRLNSARFRELRGAYEIAEKTSNYNVLRNTFNPVINSTYKGDTVLHYYIHEANNAHKKNKEFTISRSYSVQKVIIMLLHETNIDVNIQDDKGKTALHWAISYDNKHIIRKLIGANIDINIRDQSGKTALEYAKEQNKSTIVKELQDKNADDGIVPFGIIGMSSI